MTNVLATLKFRETFPGMGNILQAVNQLLDSGHYHMRQTINPAHPKHLYLDVYNKKTSHSTLSLDIPLDTTTCEVTLTDLCKSLHSSSSVRLLGCDDSVMFCLGSATYSTVSLDSIQATDLSKIILEHTFVLRKPAPHLDNLLYGMSVMANEYKYKLICSSDPQTHRWLQVNVFHPHYLHPLVICSRRLKTSKKEDLAVLSKVNMASSYGAPIIFSYNEFDSSITATICEPESPNQLHHLLLALQLL